MLEFSCCLTYFLFMPPTVKTDNPAGRLYHLLNTAQRASGGNVQTQFSTLLNFSPDDQIQKRVRIASALMAVKEVGDLLNDIDVEYFELYQEARPSLVAFFDSYVPSTEWSQYKTQYLKEADLRTLSFCSERLSRSVPEVIVSAEKLKSLEDQLEALYQEVISAEIDPNLKTEILNGLTKIKDAIHEYHIRGSRGLKQAFSILAVSTSTVANDSQCGHPEDRVWKEKVWSFIQKVGIVLNISVNSIELAHTVQHCLDAASKHAH